MRLPLDMKHPTLGKALNTLPGLGRMLTQMWSGMINPVFVSFHDTNKARVFLSLFSLFNWRC